MKTISKSGGNQTAEMPIVTTASSAKNRSVQATAGSRENAPKVKRTPEQGVVAAAYIVPGMPHPLLAPERSPAWQSLRAAYGKVREEIEEAVAKGEADLILYFSTQWLSVLGYLFQADPTPEWTLVDHNWHELGSMKYKMKVDTEFASFYAREVKAMGHYTREVNYRGFPIDTGVVVAQALLNPQNHLPAAMVSCNMYAEKQETLSIGQAACRALEKAGKRAIVVCVTGLSSRFEIRDIDPGEDKLSSLKDDEWNRKILEILGEGRLEDVSEVMREFSRQANADMGGRGVWWLNGLCGKVNLFSGKIFEYQPIWGTGAGVVGLYPTASIRSVPGWVNDEADLVERLARPSSSPPVVEEVAKAPSSQVAVGPQGVFERPIVTGDPSGQATGTSTSEQERQFSKMVKTIDVTTAGMTAPGHAIQARGAPPPVGPYPHARRVGDFLFLSGVGPRKAGTKVIPGVILNDRGEVEGHDVDVQTRSVIDNIQAILESAGSRLEDVVDVQVFLTDMKRDFATFNRVYGEYFARIGPTRTTVEVGSLPTPIAVELKVTAYLRNNTPERNA